MASTDYDIITVGGGLGGAALAKVMAERGARVLVLERETKFKDRVRGEGMTSWGCAEARELGIYDLIAGCGQEIPWWDNYAGGMQMVHREMPVTTPQGLPTLGFYHPKLQETLLASAERAGAHVRRGVKALGVQPGETPSVTFENGAGRNEVRARLMVGADGRGSLTRTWAGFSEHRDAERLFISGVLFENMRNVATDTVRLVNNFGTGRGSILFPQGEGRARVYWISWVKDGVRLQGDKDALRFIQESIDAGMPAEFFEGAEVAGPLATFEGADCWVEQPYRDGVALIGDAAASSDPSWGQGLSLTMRDARVLRDALVANDNWDAAGRAYAADHDRYFGVIHTVEDWLTRFFLETGAEADKRREKAFPLIMQEPERVPDTLFSGPDHPVDDGMRRRFFGEE